MKEWSGVKISESRNQMDVSNEHSAMDCREIALSTHWIGDWLWLTLICSGHSGTEEKVPSTPGVRPASNPHLCT
jgi:hypothetical protein